MMFSVKVVNLTVIRLPGEVFIFSFNVHLVSSLILIIACANFNCYLSSALVPRQVHFTAHFA